MKYTVFRPEDFRLVKYVLPGIPDPAASEVAARLLDQWQRVSNWGPISWTTVLEKCNADESSIISCLFNEVRFHQKKMIGDCFDWICSSDLGLLVKGLDKSGISSGKRLRIQTCLVNKPDGVPSVPLYGVRWLQTNGYIVIHNRGSEALITIEPTEKFFSLIERTCLKKSFSILFKWLVYKIRQLEFFKDDLA